MGEIESGALKRRAKTTGARRRVAIAATVAVHERNWLSRDACQSGGFLAEWQERVALGAADTSASMLTKKEDHKGENERQADRECEWNYRHGMS